MSQAPLSYLSGAGTRANEIVPLTWFTLMVATVVCVIIGVLLWLGLRRSTAAGGAAETAAVAVERGGNGLRWISWGLAISTIPLAISLVWTMTALAHIVGPPPRPGLTLDVTPHQWWWEVEYNGAEPSQRFRTANEIHIPTGTKVLVRLHGADVIHSFWVPQLSGKTDAIPGQQNVTWLEANQPGIYRGQCAEFCGFEHARMAFEVVAQTQSGFEQWRTAQLQTAPPPVTPEQARGLEVVQFRCGLCHSVRGTDAASYYGPDLTHLMSRRQIAAGMLPNNRGSLSGWVQAPQGVKPGALMPNQHLSGQQLNDVTAYLETLK